MRATAPARLLYPRLLPLALALACASVRTDHDPGVDFEALQTFAWLDEPLRERPRTEAGPAADPFAHNTLLDGRLRREVESALRARGYEQAAEREGADFWVRYLVLSREVLESDPGYISGGYIGRHHIGGLGVYGGGVRSYQEGTLVIDVIDPDTERLVWRGWSDRRGRGGHLDSERLVGAVEPILEEFPPGADDD